MTFNPDTDLLQSEKPSNKWLWKDTQPEVIRKVSKNVNLPLSDENEMIMKKLIDFVRWSQDSELNNKHNKDHLRPAVGLAAPQIGSNTNIFFVRFEWNKKTVDEKAEEFAMINTKIIANSQQISALEDGEGCLSVDKDRDGIVPRSYKIQVSGYDWIRKEEVNLTLRGYRAIVFQHEIEHNIGKLYFDKINLEEPFYKEPDWILI